MTQLTNAFIPYSVYNYKMSSATQLASLCSSLMSNRAARGIQWYAVTKLHVCVCVCVCVLRDLILHLHTRARHKVNSRNYSVGSVLVFSGWFHFLSLATAIKQENNDAAIASATTTQPQGVLSILQYSLNVTLHRLTLLLCLSTYNL